MAATAEMCCYCFESLISHFDTNSPVSPPTFDNDQFPLFVSWHKENSSKFSKKEFVLRGCKGTFAPQYIHDGLQEFSLISALKDTRFSPMTFDEIPRLECSVSLLFEFEKADHVHDWEVGIHGITLDFKDPSNGKSRNATYLPQVMPEQGWTKDEALKSLYSKAGFNGAVTKELYQSTKLTRYKSSETKLSYKEFLHMKKGGAQGKKHRISIDDGESVADVASKSPNDSNSNGKINGNSNGVNHLNSNGHAKSNGNGKLPK